MSESRRTGHDHAYFINHRPLTTNHPDSLTRLQRIVLWLLGICLVAMIVPIELRSAFLKRPMTDLQVYLRAAWAVRTGHDLYDIIDDNGWHYQYPPLFAIVMVPLADPPPGIDRAGMLPLWASVAFWYAFSVACLALSVHWLASALEERSVHPLGKAPRSGAIRSLRFCYPR